MSVIYEWDCETVADGDQECYEDGECIEHSHGASFADVLRWSEANPPLLGTRHEIVLVRDDDADRLWAYAERIVRHGKPDRYMLPEVFTDANGDDATRVPKRFHEEVQS